mgnify:CR=1 FL=1
MGQCFFWRGELTTNLWLFGSGKQNRVGSRDVRLYFRSSPMLSEVSKVLREPEGSPVLENVVLEGSPGNLLSPWGTFLEI